MVRWVPSRVFVHDTVQQRFTKKKFETKTVCFITLYNFYSIRTVILSHPLKTNKKTNKQTDNQEQQQRSTTPARRLKFRNCSPKTFISIGFIRVNIKCHVMKLHNHKIGWAIRSWYSKISKFFTYWGWIQNYRFWGQHNQTSEGANSTGHKF